MNITKITHEEDFCFVTDKEKEKTCKSDNYNYYFNKENGFFARFGNTKEDNPLFAPFGPEILDLEISVNGCPNNCSFCYKGNTNEKPKNMSFDTFKKIISKFSQTLTQVAFGITGVQTNPDFIKMMQYCHEIGVIPNFTLSGIDLTSDIANKVAKLVGALAVSVYPQNKNIGYNAIDAFANVCGIKQTNVHLMISKQTLKHTKEVIDDYLGGEPRLKNVNAFVFLGLKPKGRSQGKYDVLPYEDFFNLVEYCFDNNVNIGFDSCSAPKFERAVKGMGNLTEHRKNELLTLSESCESGLMSSYVNVDGKFFPCSFCEGETFSVDVLKYGSFLDVWYHKDVVAWRNNMIKNSINGTRKCPVFNLE